MYPNLKLQIWRSGLRQNRLAQMVGVDDTLLSKIVNGFRPAAPELRNKIASILECDEDWLFQSPEPLRPSALDGVKQVERTKGATGAA